MSLVNNLADPSPSHFIVVFIPRPIDGCHFAFDFISAQETPTPTVITVIAIIAQHKERTARNGNGPVIIYWLSVFG